MTATIVIADDHPLFRTALTQILSTFQIAGGVTCIACASLADVHQRLEEEGLEPDLVLLDLHMPGANGFAGLINLRGCFPQVPIAIISGDDSQQAVSAAEQFGAIGFISKSLEPGPLRDAITDLLKGKRHFDHGGNEQDQALKDIAARLATLTPHQFRVYALLSQGMLNKQIAYELSITEPTVKSHVTAILRKLGLRKRTEVILLAQKFELGSGTTARN